MLLHGNHGSWRHWARNIEALSARFRVVAPDMPGYGDSDLPEETSEVDDIPKRLAVLLAAGLAGICPPPERYLIAGFSFGGIVGGHLAAIEGERIARIAFIGPGGMALRREPTPATRRPEPGMSTDELGELHAYNLGVLMFSGPAAVDDLALEIQHENIATSRLRLHEIFNEDPLLHALPHIRAKALGIWGENDAYSAPYLADREATLGEYFPDLEFHVVAGAGHWVVFEAADTVNEILLEWMARQI